MNLTLSSPACERWSLLTAMGKVFQRAAAIYHPSVVSPCVAENSSCNIHTEFECGNGECINYQLTCDGVAHCKDKSDEKMQYCGKTFLKMT